MEKKLISYVLVRDLAAGKVALVEYKADATPNAKRSGLWIPAPELAEGEHPEDSARKVLDSLGLVGDGVKLALAGVDSFVTRDWHVLFNYVADVPTGTELKGDERYASARWYDLAALPEAKAYAHGNWERSLVLKLAAVIL